MTAGFLEKVSKMKKMKCNRRKGFTLLEVLLVAGILALLAAVVVPNMLGRAEVAKKRLVLGQIGPSGTISAAIDQFHLDCGRLPENIEELYKKPGDMNDDDERWQGPYMKGQPDDLKDPWNNPYNFKSPGNVNEDGFDLWSNGPNGKDDGGKDDDIANWSEK